MVETNFLYLKKAFQYTAKYFPKPYNRIVCAIRLYYSFDGYVVLDSVKMAYKDEDNMSFLTKYMKILIFLSDYSKHI